MSVVTGRISLSTPRLRRGIYRVESKDTSMDLNRLIQVLKVSGYIAGLMLDLSSL
jgi:hypothetical protein